MVIKEDIVEKYISNRLEIDLPSLSLKNNEFSVSGSGFIKLDDNGAFQLKIISKKNRYNPLEYLIKQINKSFQDAGKLIPREEYFFFKRKK